MMAGAGRSTGQTLFRGHGPLAIQRLAQRTHHASQQPFAHRHVHHAPGAFHFIARMEILIVAQQDDADFILIHIEGDADSPPGNRTNSSYPTPGRPETVAMPVETFLTTPTSRGVNGGWKASRACASRRTCD